MPRPSPLAGISSSALGPSSVPCRASMLRRSSALRRVSGGALLAACVLSGCYESHERELDARDGSVRDGSRADAGERRDAEAPADASVPDAGRRDGGRLDAGGMDGGRRDAGRADGGRRDAGRADAGSPSTALRFERSERMYVAATPLLDLTGNHTLELFVRPTGLDGRVCEKGDRASGRSHFAVFYESGRVVAGYTAAGVTYAVSAPIAADVWTHVALVVSGGALSLELALLLDGARVATASVPNRLGAALNDLPWVFGGFEGDLDEVRLWQYARTDANIAGAMGRRLARTTPGMEAYLPLEERGQLALDWTLRGHDGVLGNLTTPDPADPSWITDGAIP